MQDAPVGRGGDEPDGGRDRHDGPATPCAGLLTGRALRAREHRLSFHVTPTVATSPEFDGENDFEGLILCGDGLGRRIYESSRAWIRWLRLVIDLRPVLSHP